MQLIIHANHAINDFPNMFYEANANLLEFILCIVHYEYHESWVSKPGMVDSWCIDLIYLHYIMLLMQVASGLVPVVFSW